MLADWAALRLLREAPKDTESWTFKKIHDACTSFRVRAKARRRGHVRSLQRLLAFLLTCSFSLRSHRERAEAKKPAQPWFFGSGVVSSCEESRLGVFPRSDPSRFL